MKSYDYDSYGRRVGQSRGTGASGDAYRFYGLDPNGSVEEVQDGDTGFVADEDRYEYDPYGALEKDEGDLSTSAQANPFRYEGFYYDSGVKQYDMQARMYDPGVGRFLSEDRYESASAEFALSADPLTQNRYAFGGGNPISNIEWDGHHPSDVGWLVGKESGRGHPDRSAVTVGLAVGVASNGGRSSDRPPARAVDSTRATNAELDACPPAMYPSQSLTTCEMGQLEAGGKDNLDDLRSAAEAAYADPVAFAWSAVRNFDPIGAVGETLKDVSLAVRGSERAQGRLATGGFFFGSLLRRTFLAGGHHSTTPDTVDLPAAESFGNPKLLQDHFDRHGSDFGATSPEEYARMASEFFQRGVTGGAQVKVDGSGVIRIYDERTDTFGSYNPDGTTKTLYRPDPAVHGRPSNQAYFDDQPGTIR